MSGATRVSIIPAGNPNRPGAKLRGSKPDFITIHETANTAPSANAEMHRSFVHGGGGPHNVSFHAVVDDHESIQLLPWDEVGWHAGDGSGDGNRDSIGVEICVNKGANWQQTLANTAMLVTGLMKEFSIPIERVVQHNHWSGKNCPTTLRKGGWESLIAQLRLPSSSQQPSTKTAIQAYWEANGGVPLFGLPLHEGERTEVLEDGQTYQVRYFERARLQWRSDQGVTLGRIGYELLKLRGEI